MSTAASRATAGARFIAHAHAAAETPRPRRLPRTPPTHQGAPDPDSHRPPALRRKPHYRLAPVHVQTNQLQYDSRLSEATALVASTPPQPVDTYTRESQVLTRFAVDRTRQRTPFCGMTGASFSRKDEALLASPRVLRPRRPLHRCCSADPPGVGTRRP